MSSPPKIDNLKELLEPYLDGAKLIDYKTKYLTKPGDNYGSTILALSTTIQKDDEEPTKLELVAKMPPETAGTCSLSLRIMYKKFPINHKRVKWLLPQLFPQEIIYQF